MQRGHDKAGLNHVKWQYRKWLQNRNCHFESLWSVYLQLLDLIQKSPYPKHQITKCLAKVGSPSHSYIPPSWTNKHCYFGGYRNMEHIVASFVANVPNRNSSLLKYSRPTPLRHRQGQRKLQKLGRGWRIGCWDFEQIQIYWSKKSFLACPSR